MVGTPRRRECDRSNFTSRASSETMWYSDCKFLLSQHSLCQYLKIVAIPLEYKLWFVKDDIASEILKLVILFSELCFFEPKDTWCVLNPNNKCAICFDST